MRQRLLDATCDSLVDLGWAKTTTTEVSKRAGVSRGAQLHHFPNKFELVKATIDHLLLTGSKELLAQAEGLGENRRTRDVLQFVADVFTSRMYVAALELWVAARTDESIRKQMIEFELDFGRQTLFIAVHLLGVNITLGQNRQLVQMMLEVMRGFGLTNSLRDDRARQAEVLDVLALTLDKELVFS